MEFKRAHTPLIVRTFSPYGGLYSLGWRRVLSMHLFLAVGVWNLNEWKCICVTSSESVLVVAVHLRSEGRNYNTGSVSARFTGLTARTQSPGVGAAQQTRSEPGGSAVCFQAGNPPVVLHKCTLGVSVPVECQHPHGASVTAH